jgi:hypothetical protein
MAKKALSEETSETTAVAEAAGEIVDGNPQTGALSVTGSGVMGDLDASDISFPRLQIVQGMGNLSENFKKGEIVLDGESLISDGTEPVEFTVCRIGKMFEENVDWDSGEIPRILSKEQAVEAGGSFEWGSNGQKPDWLPIADALVCITGPDAEVFPFEFEGAYFAFALWRIKGTAYKRAAVPIFTAARMYYRDGLRTGTFLLNTEKQSFGGKAVHVPKIRRGKRNTPDFADWLAEYC